MVLDLGTKIKPAICFYAGHLPDLDFTNCPGDTMCDGQQQVEALSRQNDDRKAPTIQRLLKGQALVAGNEALKAV